MNLRKNTDDKVPAGVRKLIGHRVLPGKKAALVELQGKSLNIIYKSGMTLPPEIEAKSLQDRPMIWRDLNEFSARHGRTIADTVYDLALLTNHAASTKTRLRTVAPFDLEFLVRLYDLYPSSCPWKRPGVRETFQLLYGNYIKSFDPALEQAVTLALGRRYAKMLGRVDTAQYRWLSEDGKITRRLSNILAKVEDVRRSGQGDENPRVVFEKIGKRVWELRGFDIEANFPMPTKESVLKPPGSRGRVMRPKKIPTPLHAPSYEGGAFS